MLWKMETYPVIQPSLSFAIFFVYQPCQLDLKQIHPSDFTIHIHTGFPCTVLCCILKFPEFLCCLSSLWIRDSGAIWKLLCCLAMMDHVEGMSAVLGFVIIHPACVLMHTASLSIKDELIVNIAQANGMPLCGIPFVASSSLSYSKV